MELDKLKKIIADVLNVDENEQGLASKEQNDILNHHICVSHSNLEDLLLFTAVGGNFFWMLLSRWAMSLILVWERKFEMMFVHRSVSVEK